MQVVWELIHQQQTMIIWNQQIVAVSSSGVAEVAASIARGLVFGQISLNRLTRSVFIGSHKFYFMLDNIDYRDCPTDPGSGGVDSLSRGYNWGLLLSCRQYNSPYFPDNLRYKLSSTHSSVQ